MELFAVEVARQEVVDLLEKEIALDDAKRFSLKSVAEKTMDLKTLDSMKDFLLLLKQERIKVQQGIVSDVKKVYEDETRKMLKEIETDYRQIQQAELQRLMTQL